MRTLKHSEADGETLYNMADDLAKATNPQCWFDLANDHTMNTPERLAGIEAIKNKMGELLEGGVFRDFISEL